MLKIHTSQMIRLFEEQDKVPLVKILKMNIPQYFHPSEEQDYIDYFSEHLEEYYVAVENEQVIGGGGINYLYDEEVARISWDLIHPDFQGRGIGKEILRYRIEQIKKKEGIGKIVVRTSQLAYRFYQKSGFQLEKVEKDFWAKGFDLYEMVIPLN